MPTRERKKRRSTARERAESHKSGFATSTVIVPDGLSFFNPEEGMVTLDIVPFITGKGNFAIQEEGVLHYEKTFWIYRNIGPDESQQICTSKTYKERDFIQDYRRKEARNPDADADYLKSLEPKERQLFLVSVHGGKDPLQLWEYSFHLFGRALDKRIRLSPESRGWDQFYYPDEDGFSLEITFSKESRGGYSFLEASSIDFIPRDKALPDDVANHGLCLDDLIAHPTYEEVKAAFFGTADDEGDEDDDSDGNGKPDAETAERTAPPARQEKEPDAETEPKKKKRKPKKEKNPIDSVGSGVGTGHGSFV